MSWWYVGATAVGVIGGAINAKSASDDNADNLSAEEKDRLMRQGYVDRASPEGRQERFKTDFDLARDMNLGTGDFEGSGTFDYSKDWMDQNLDYQAEYGAKNNALNKQLYDSANPRQSQIGDAQFDMISGSVGDRNYANDQLMSGLASYGQGSNKVNDMWQARYGPGGTGGKIGGSGSGGSSGVASPYSTGMVGNAAGMSEFNIGNLPSMSEYNTRNMPGMSEFDRENMPELSEFDQSNMSDLSEVGADRITNLQQLGSGPQLNRVGYQGQQEKLGQNVLPNYQRGDYGGGTNEMRDMLEGQLMERLSANGQLTPEQAKMVEQQTLRSQGARGNVLGDSAAFQETLNKFNYADDRARQNMSDSLGYLGSGQTAFDVQGRLRGEGNALRSQELQDQMGITAQRNIAETQGLSNNLAALGFDNAASQQEYGNLANQTQINNQAQTQQLQNEFGLANQNNQARTQQLQNELGALGFNNQSRMQQLQGELDIVGVNNSARSQAIQNELAAISTNNQSRSAQMQNELAALGFNNQSRTQQLQNNMASTGFNNQVRDKAAAAKLASGRAAYSDQLQMAKYLDNLSRDDQQYSNQMYGGLENQLYNRVGNYANTPDPSNAQNYQIGVRQNPMTAQFTGFDPYDSSALALGGIPMPGKVAPDPWAQAGANTLGNVSGWMANRGANSNTTGIGQNNNSVTN